MPRFVAAGAVLAAVCCAATVCAQWPPWLAKKPREPRYPDILVSAAWLAEQRGGLGLVLVDARGAGAYRGGHIAGAVSLPADSILPDAPFTSIAASRGLTGEERLVVYGEGDALEDAAHLFWLFEVSGAADVLLLDGGIDAWRLSGGAIEAAVVTPESSPWRRDREVVRRATIDQVDGEYGRLGGEIIDARGAAVWERGHIPHSLPFDFSALVREDGTLPAPQEIRERFGLTGPRPSEPVDLDGRFIVYGAGPSDAGALGYLMLRLAGIDSLRYFPEGWSAWSADSTRPVVRIISAEELRDRLHADSLRFVADRPPSRFVLLDVRSSLDFGAPGHLAGAANVGSHVFDDSLEAVLAEHWPGIDRARDPMVVYCYGPNCVRSRNCTTRAARHGFVRLEIFRGGIDEWRKIGEPLAF